MSEGGLSLHGTPFQIEKQIQDSPELGAREFFAWGDDPDPEWVKIYTQRSRPDVYDWLAAMGLRFSGLRSPTGNSVPRFHENPERGFGVVRPIYQQCLRTPSIRFEWNTRVTDVRMENGRVSGVAGKRLRTGESVKFRAPAVVIATGGFQNNTELVRKHWPAGDAPDKVLLGSGANSVGSGLELATRAGAVLGRMNQQWNYTWGFPDPRDPAGQRGVFIRIMAAIWVNRNGQRFTDEIANAKFQMEDISRQPGGRYWAIFDAAGKGSTVTAGTEWADPEKVERLLFGSPEVKSARTVEELAQKIGVPESNLAETIARYNEMVEAGKDREFQRFGFSKEARQMPLRRTPTKIVDAPFYAMPLYVVTRKSLGGIRIDSSCRVLNSKGEVIPGLYAAGEVSGFGGVNGNSGLEGTFIGPSILQGRIVGQQVQTTAPAPVRGEPTSAPRLISGRVTIDRTCAKCHDLPALTAQSRPGYWHFEQAHRVVVERQTPCTVCHAELSPFQPAAHKIDRSLQVNNCVLCHLPPPVTR